MTSDTPTARTDEPTLQEIARKLRRQAEPLASIRIKDVLDITAYEAADALDAAQAENERLRAALREIRAGRYCLMPPPDYVTDPTPMLNALVDAALEART